MALDPTTDADVAWLARAIAGHGLTSSRLELDGRRVDEPAWSALLTRSWDRRLAGHLVDAIHSGALVVDPDGITAAADQHAAFMAGCLRLEALLLNAIEALEGVGIEYRVLKGSAAAHLDYTDPALRCFGDVDILVRPQQIDAAVALFHSMGFRRRHPEARGGFDRRFAKSVTFRTPGHLELDLHRTLALGPYGATVGLDDLWAGSECFQIGGRAVLALGPDERFLHACYHAALGDPVPRLVALRDIAAMLEASSRVDLERVRDLARRWRGEAVLARAIRSTWEAFELLPTALSIWAAGHRGARADRRAMRSYLDPSLGYAARSVAAMRVIPGPRAKAAYVWALAFPQRGYLDGRHRSRMGRWWAALREAARLRGAP